MQKRVIYRNIALIMAVLVAFSSFGYSVDLHFCQGNLKGFNFFGEAQSCHQKMAKCPNHKNEIADQPTNDCCKNLSLNIEKLDQDGLVLDLDFTTLEYKLSAVHIISSMSSLQNSKQANKKIQLRAPPLTSREFYVLYESFLL